MTMAKTKQLQVLLTAEEEQELLAFVKNEMMSTGQIATKSSVARSALLKYIRNGQPDNKQDDEQESLPENDPTTPTEENDNPFADLNFDT